MNAVRVERDALGQWEVPADAYWGIHTARARRNFEISGTPISRHPVLVAALAEVKLAAATVNAAHGLIDPLIGRAIVAACRRIIAGELHDHFVVDVIQGGAGTSSNMNANEVIANAALEALGIARGRYDVVHPIDHVNRSQSTNDVYPTAIRLATVRALRRLAPELTALAASFEDRGDAFAGIRKIGRTQLQDAVPMSLGDEFTAFAAAISEDLRRLEETVPLLLECSLGGTAIGTGVTADAAYRGDIVAALAAASDLPVTPAAHLFEASWDTSAFLQTSSLLRRIAVKLSKISSDLRLLSSGPQTGLGEIRLPAQQAGSSIMPGKVNPVIPEAMNQVAFAVMGADVTIGIAAESGQLQLNAFEPVIAHSLLQAIEWLTNGVRMLRERCVDGIRAREETLERNISVAVGAVTALVPAIGYEAAARAAHQSLATGESLVDAVVAHAGIDRDEVAQLLAAAR